MKYIKYINWKITELKLASINQFPFIHKICCGYQNSELDEHNDEIKNPFSLCGTIC